MAVMTMRDALNQALREEMNRDDKVYLMGEEVGAYQGAYKVTRNLLQEFGPKRVIDSPITELGFVRVLGQASVYGLSIAQARTLLQRMKESSVQFVFVPDTHDASRLPAWVKTPKQVTDGHLARLADSTGAVLATLDKSIPESFLIPA